MRYGEASNLNVPVVSGSVQLPMTQDVTSPRAWSSISSQYPSRQTSEAAGTVQVPQANTVTNERARTDEYESPEAMQMLILLAGKLDEAWPLVELWKDPKYKGGQFPYEEQEKGRQGEVDRLMQFEAVQDIVPEKDDTVYDTTWVEEWRGDLVRGRLCIRQYNDGYRSDCFSGTPDSFFVRFQMMKASTDRGRTIMIVDVSVAFMHSPIGDERVVVRVPKGVTSSTGYWLLLKALNGTRKASQMWTEFSAEKVIGWGASRNDHNPCIFRIEDTDLDIEQHGDDFVIEGPRQAVVEIRDKFNKAFLVKKADIISLHPDDDKEGHFLHRHMWTKAAGMKSWSPGMWMISWKSLEWAIAILSRRQV